MAKKASKVKIMVGSTVYGFEDQLSQIVAQLSTLGYDVLNSHNGSIKVNPNLSNLENCVNAVAECDIFLGIIRPFYGTGNIGDLNITFEEIKEAIRLTKPYWFLVHRDVVFARNLFKKMKLKLGDTILIEGKALFDAILTEDKKLFDKRSIEVYEYVTKEGVPVVLRNGNWVQEFYRLDEMMVYINTQFQDQDFIKQFLNQNNQPNGQ